MKHCVSLLTLILLMETPGRMAYAARTISQANSKCEVKVSSGEYPSYTVLKNKKDLYSPKSDGVVAALISPSGKFLALSAGEISLLDVEKDKFDYGVVIVNCDTGKIKGYRKGQATLIKSWNGEKGIDISDFLNLSGNSRM